MNVSYSNRFLFRLPARNQNLHQINVNPDTRPLCRNKKFRGRQTPPSAPENRGRGGVPLCGGFLPVTIQYLNLLL